VSSHDDDHATLGLVLGQTHHLLGEDGDVHVQRLGQAATLRVQRDGEIYHPMPGDNWDQPSYEAVLCVDPNLVPGVRG
jgi:hypothetical protein